MERVNGLPLEDFGKVLVQELAQMCEEIRLNIGEELETFFKL